MYKSIIKTLYLKPVYNTDQRTSRIEKIRDDVLLYLVGDSEGNRELKMINNPKYTFYLAKTDYKYHRLSAPKDDLIPIVCEYSKRHDRMAEAVGLKDEYNLAKKDWSTKRDWIQRNLYNNPKLYHADFDIEDDFRLRFNETNGEHASDIEYATSFTDIETRMDLGDVNQYVADAPISSICHIDSKSETIYAMVLNDDNVPEVRETFNDLQNYVSHLKEFLQQIRESAIERIIKDKGNPNNIHSYKFNFKFYLCETEAELISQYFKVIKDTSPDFCGIWNISYDMNYIKNRAEKLGLNMADLASSDLIPPSHRYFMYAEDSERFRAKSQVHYSRYFDKVLSTSPTQWYCQMAMHSNLRKRFLENDYKLDSIGDKYAYINKVNLEKQGYTIKNVYSKNFKLFLDYAILDVIVQFMIERVNQDVQRQMINCKDVNFFHGLRKTFTIKGELSTFLKDKGEIIGNNKTYDINESIPGAIIVFRFIARREKSGKDTWKANKRINNRQTMVFY